MGVLYEYSEISKSYLLTKNEVIDYLVSTFGINKSNIKSINPVFYHGVAENLNNEIDSWVYEVNLKTINKSYYVSPNLVIANNGSRIVRSDNTNLFIKHRVFIKVNDDKFVLID